MTPCADVAQHRSTRRRRCGFALTLLAGLAFAGTADAAPRAAPAKASPAKAFPEAIELSRLRRAEGLGPVSIDPKLTAAAQAQADAMARRGVMSHDVAGSFSRRMSAAGIRAGEAAENVAVGQKDLAEVLRDWMASSGHRRNILMASATRVGLARASGPGGLYWALVIAAPEPRPAAPAARGDAPVWGGLFGSGAPRP